MYRTVIAALLSGLWVVGCGSGQQEPTGLAAEVAGKAQQVAGQIGGPAGFGGAWMDGYGQHMDDHMGFHGVSYLADPEGELDIEFINDSDWPCTFHLVYVRGADGLGEQYEDVTVPPGGAVTLQMPCAEIVGVGSLEDVGVVAADLDDGIALDNRWCVPGFLNSDFACGPGAPGYACTLGPDVDDLDDDGDTEELIVVTAGLWSHMVDGGMQRHMWPDGGWFGGMMGGPMMGGSRR